jgi:hypothetical protein
VSRTSFSFVTDLRPRSWKEARRELVVASEALKKVVTTNPSLALGLALGMGVAAGWLVKRR